jgi:hypothetical protein
MGSASLNFAAWGMAWREFRQKLVPHCSWRDCGRRPSIWRNLLRRRPSILLQGSPYCVESCLARALLEELGNAPSEFRRVPAPHRIPLGLLLLSRRQLTADQLRAALAAQRKAGRGRIGEWLQTLGFASEQQVTAALARQWSCPVLRASSFSSGNARLAERRERNRVPQVPRSLLEDFGMVPVDYVESTATLHMAFSDSVDYRVLYAIERILGCRTEPCMAAPSLVRRSLQSLSRRRGETEVVFDRVANAAEFSRIIVSYCVRLAASEVTVADCGTQLWVRLLRPSSSPLDLLLRSSR